MSTANTLATAYVLPFATLLAYLVIVALKITRLEHKLKELEVLGVTPLLAEEPDQQALDSGDLAGTRTPRPAAE
jgi:hypothetical protein